MNPKKCVFGVPKGKLLGYIMSERGIEANPKNTLFGIQPDVEPSEVCERCGQVCDQVASLSRFDHYVININGDCWFRPLDLVRLIEQVDLIGKALLYAPLIGGASVL